MEKEISTEEIRLTTRCVDSGYPDPGHDEYFLVRASKRSSKFLQKILGDKEYDLLAYGETKPKVEGLKKDIEHYKNKIQNGNTF